MYKLVKSFGCGNTVHWALVVVGRLVYKPAVYTQAFLVSKPLGITERLISKLLVFKTQPFTQAIFEFNTIEKRLVHIYHNPNN